MSKKVLIVDDEPDYIEITQIYLKMAGYEVITASDGQEGLDMARSQKPDLIILDVMLPKIEGYKVCSMLKFDEEYKDIPIILFSARASQEGEKMMQEVKADAYIVKPSTSEHILEEVARLLRDR